MHTVKIIGIGFALLGLLLFAASRMRLGGGNPVGYAVKLFIPLWFVGALINLGIGVIRAGYTVAEELPIGAVVFGVPALSALLIAWLAGRIAR